MDLNLNVNSFEFALDRLLANIFQENNNLLFATNNIFSFFNKRFKGIIYSTIWARGLEIFPTIKIKSTPDTKYINTKVVIN
jgi:hypothetical protein